MTLQDVFDKIYVGALTQMKCARNGPVYACALLDKDGKSRCFIGMCLTPEQLAKAVDHSNRYGFNPHVYLASCGLEHANQLELYQFIGTMLAIHDSAPVEVWRERLESAAKQFNLRIPELLRPGDAAGGQVP